MPEKAYDLAEVGAIVEAEMLGERLRAAAPTPSGMLQAYHRRIRTLSDLLIEDAQPLLNVVGADTCFALGHALGTVGKVLALLGRDIDGLKAAGDQPTPAPQDAPP